MDPIQFMIGVVAMSVFVIAPFGGVATYSLLRERLSRENAISIAIIIAILLPTLLIGGAGALVLLALRDLTWF